MESSFLSSFGLADEEMLADFTSPSGEQPGPAKDLPTGKPVPNAQNTSLWRVDLSVGAGSQGQKSAVLSLGEELLAYLPTPPPEEDAPPAAHEAPPASQPMAPEKKATPSLMNEMDNSLQKFESAMRAYRERITNPNMLVETSVDGKMVARTLISLSGDTQTIVSGLANPALIEQHLKTLRTAQEQRRAVFKSIITIDSAIMRVLQPLSKPLSPVAALALGWQVSKLVMEIVKNPASLEANSAQDF